MSAQTMFDGSDYVPALDDLRLVGQLRRIYDCMIDGQWRTLDEIARATGAPHASVSAQLRHLRKPKHGAHTIEKRSRGAREVGLYEYRMLARVGALALVGEATKGDGR